MARLLIVHHSPSPGTHNLLESVREGATDSEISGVDVVTRPALSVTAADALEADGYLVGSPVNLGYLAGALKHFFDLIYYPCLDATQGRPFGAWLHGQSDTTGGERAIDSITTGLGWKATQPTVTVIGDVTSEDRDAAWELGAATAATLMEE